MAGAKAQRKKGSESGQGQSSSKGRSKGRSKGKGGSKSARRKASRTKGGPRLAETADKHVLYELAVQDPAQDVAFLQKAYESVRGHRPRRLREDFCGTAAVCAQWVRLGEEFSAEGFDLDGDTLEWGRQRHLGPLGDAAERVQLHCKDVREPGLAKSDVTCAHNFSYQVFHTRPAMLQYFKFVLDSLDEEGVFVLDLYGGWESTEELEEERYIDGSDAIYVWDQIRYSPVTGRQDCAIHFRFKDGSELRNAFYYEWRYWTMSELKDILQEVGFVRIDSWFEVMDDEGDGTGVFEPSDEGLNCESWLGYLVAYK